MTKTTKTPPEFVALLAEIMAGYGKALPDPAIIHSWWTNLAPFSGDVVRRAFAAYKLDKPDHAPVPNSIAARCRLLDGRPDDNEAWALALASHDEANTVVWTLECAKAFTVCRPILDRRDEVGARMAFKDAYARLVADARANGEPVDWRVAAGWDQTLRAGALKRAVAAGLLPAPQVAALLPPPEAKASDEPGAENDKARAQLAQVKQLLAEGAAAKEAARERLAAEAAVARDAEYEAWKRQTNKCVEQYLKDNP